MIAEIDCVFDGQTVDHNGVMRIAFVVKNHAAGNALLSALKRCKQTDTVINLTIDKHYERRSLNANNYMWALCKKIADNLQITKEEVYKKCIKENGVKATAPYPKEEAEMILKSFHTIGTGWFAEKIAEEGDTIWLDLYIGSSKYNTKQMSNLINSVIAECHALDIPTIPPHELKRLVQAWGEKEKSND